MGTEKERENLREWSRGKVTTVLTVKQEMILGLCSVKQFRGFRVFFLLESVFTPPASPGSPYSKVTVWTTMPKGQPERRRKRRSRPTVNSYNGNLLGGFLLNHTLFWGHIFCPCVLFCFFHFLLFHWFFFFCISMFCFQSQPSSLWWEVAARETSQSLEHLGLPKLSSLIWSGLEPQNFVWAKVLAMNGPSFWSCPACKTGSPPASRLMNHSSLSQRGSGHPGETPRSFPSSFLSHDSPDKPAVSLSLSPGHAHIQ